MNSCDREVKERNEDAPSRRAAWRVWVDTAGETAPRAHLQLQQDQALTNMAVAATRQLPLA